jgi:DNA-binding MarR family transcriptional regulator
MQGLITREVLPRDRRVVLVNLTNEGRHLIDELMPAVLDAEKKLLSDFDETEIAELQRLSAKLLNAVEPR